MNFPREARKELTFTTKELVQEGWKKKTVRKRVQCFELSTVLGISVVKTHQGFWRKMLRWAMANGLDWELMDLRTKDLLPLPKLGMMKGFRFNQKELLVKGLSFGCSGVIKAATRYGKFYLMLNMLRAWKGVQTVVLIPGSDLLRQTVDEMKAALPDREIKLIGAGSTVKFQSEDITVCSMDSMHLLDPGPVRLVLIDEAHSVIAQSRCEHLPKFAYARIYAFGATPTGRFDGWDFLLEGLVGPILAERTFREGVEEGAICPIKVLMINWPIGAVHGERDYVYRHMVHLNELFGKYIRYLSDKVIPREWQTLFFIKTEKQADFLQEWIGRDVSVAMAKKLTDKKRKEMAERVKKNHIQRVLCSDIYVQGVTFHEIMCLVNCGGGGASTSTIQKPGRLAEIRPGKNAGLMVDFLFCPKTTGVPGAGNPSMGKGFMALCRESTARLAAYKEIGYEVHIVGRAEVEEWMAKQNITAPTAG